MIPFLHRVIVLQYVLYIVISVGKILNVLNDDVIISNDFLPSCDRFTACLTHCIMAVGKMLNVPIDDVIINNEKLSTILKTQLEKIL